MGTKHTQVCGSEVIGQKRYDTEETLAFRKNKAPEGRMYLVVRFIKNGITYTSAKLVSFGLNDDEKETVCRTLWSNLATKHRLLS